MLIPTGERLGLRSQLLSALRPVLDLFPSQKPQVAARNAGAEAVPARDPASASQAEQQLRAELAKLLPGEPVGVYAGAGKSGMFRSDDFASVGRDEIILFKIPRIAPKVGNFPSTFLHKENSSRVIPF